MNIYELYDKMRDNGHNVKLNFDGKKQEVVLFVNNIQQIKREI